MAYGWKIEHNSSDITSKVSGFSITGSLESHCREMTLDIADPAFYAGLDFSQLPETPTIEIFTKTGAEWVSQGKFFIEQPALNSTIKSELLQGVWGRSLTALLGEPFAPKVSKAWDDETTLFAICSEICALAGISWDPAYSDIDDYAIHAQTYEADGVYPIDVIVELAEFAGALVTTDRLGHLCIKRIEYAPSSEDFTVTDPDIAEISETPEWPQFGNRIRITPSGTTGNYSLALKVQNPCLPADGATRTKIFAQVRDPEGNPVDGLVVEWSIASESAALDSPSSNTQEIVIEYEEQRAKNYYTVEVDFEPSLIDGIWAYGDTARADNLASGGYTLDGNAITLITGKLAFCDQLLVITYRARGIAVNFLQAGTVSEDVTVTAGIEGLEESESVFIDNPCECPPTITLKANPTSLHPDEVSKLLVYVEESGPVTTGKVVFMAEVSASRRGALAWTAARLGKVNISNERVSARNEISGVTQCETSMYPESVTSVYRADEDGNQTGSDLYGSHAGKVVNLSTIVTTGEDLLVNYKAYGAAVNKFTAKEIGTARITAWIMTTREQPAEASVTIDITDNTSVIDDYPDTWSASDDDGGYGGIGGSDALGDDDGFDNSEGEDGEGPLADFNWCVPDNVSSDPNESALGSRFKTALEHDCDCEVLCEEEFDIFGTTQSYDGASYRTISDIVLEDYGYEEGSPEYWEKYAELKADALSSCAIECGVCESADPLTWESGTVSLNPGDSGEIAVSGGVGPYTWSIVGDGFTLAASITTEGTNVVTAAPDSCGGASITITDSCGNSINSGARATVGRWWYIGGTAFPGGKQCANWITKDDGYKKMTFGCSQDTGGAVWTRTWDTVYGPMTFTASAEADGCTAYYEGCTYVNTINCYMWIC